MTAVKSARKEKRATSIGFHGNIVDVSLCYQDDDDHDEYVGGDASENYHILKVWEEFVREYKRTGQLLVELGSGSSNHFQQLHCNALGFFTMIKSFVNHQYILNKAFFLLGQK